jgi:hypothetical protein
MNYVIGIDFDNTLASYDDVLYDEALQRGLICPGSRKGKKNIRDMIRQIPNGEIEWQKLQAVVYGPRMNEAKLIEGVKAFLAFCMVSKVRVFIVSHKTEYAKMDKTVTNLRQASMSWMKEKGFFGEYGFGLTTEDVFFESTRVEKIKRITKIKCTHFIDDLEETFLEDIFPTHIKKILYTPHVKHSDAQGVRLAASWKAIKGLIFAHPLNNQPLEMKTVFSELIGCKITSLQRIVRGRNSKVYKLLCDDNSLYAGKVYFCHDLDKRNRLQVEFTSFQFLWTYGIRCIPQPIVMDTEQGYAIYEYVDGTQIEPKEVSENDIDYAVQFLTRLAECKNREGSKDLPMASEACFSIQAIINAIQNRLEKLLVLQNYESQFNGLHRFLKDDFIPLFKEIRKWCLSSLNQAGISLVSELSYDERTLSPSDFGFHNALRRNTGEIVFIDFEYFGWDDPAKMVSDFLLHPGMELSLNFKHQFFTEILKCFKQHLNLSKRIEIVYPLCGLNWCLILLNEFIPEDFQRRTFAGSKLNKSNLLATQFSKSEHMLHAIRSEYEQFPYRN